MVSALHDGGFVHGDICDVNMMTCHQWETEEKAQDVFLRDFDWAGREGLTIYPPNLNLQTVKRHKGAKDGARIRQEHDWAMVDCIFDSMGCCSHCFCLICMFSIYLPLNCIEPEQETSAPLHSTSLTHSRSLSTFSVLAWNAGL